MFMTPHKKNKRNNKNKLVIQETPKKILVGNSGFRTFTTGSVLVVLRSGGEALNLIMVMTI